MTFNIPYIRFTPLFLSKAVDPHNECHVMSPLINPRRMLNPRRMRSEGYGSRFCVSVCLSVCLSVFYYYSRTTGYEAAYERYQHIQCYKGRKNNVAILLKRLRSRDMA